MKLTVLFTWHNRERKITIFSFLISFLKVNLQQMEAL